MDIQSFGAGYCVVNNCFNNEQLQNLWADIEYIENNNLLAEPSRTGTAIDPATGDILKNNKAVFLDKLFHENKIKHILPTISKLFSIEIAKSLATIHPCYSLFENLNVSHSLLSYYETEHHYRSHTDNSVFTFLTWIYREPKSWSGGELILTESNTTIEAKNNRTLIIPGSFSHEVLPVKLHTDQPNMGRYCISTFGYIKPTQG